MLGRVRGFLASMPEEVWFLLRIGAYAIFIGTVYWFLTYENAGTVLLLGFGIAAGFGTIVLAIAVRSQRGQAGPPAGAGGDDAGQERVEPADGPDGPFGDERGRIPGASVAPIVLGFGVALAALGLVFGPGLILAGGVIGLVGAVDWGRSASAEYRAIETTDDRETAAGPAGSSGEAARDSGPQPGETSASTP